MKKLDKMLEKLNVIYAVIADNTYLNAIQNAILALVPLILVGSIITVLNVAGNFIPNMPNLSVLSTFSMGMLGVGTSFLIAYYVMEKKKLHDRTLISAVVAAAVFLYLIEPQFVEGGILFDTSRLGASGMITAILVGIFVSLVMAFSAHFKLFKEDSAIPDFIKVWFETIIPILLILFIVWIVQDGLHFSMYSLIITVFSPLEQICQTFWGFLLIQFLYVFFYAFGISPWFLNAIILPTRLAAIEANAAAVAVGSAAVNIGTKEFVNSYLTIGGLGQTLPLVLLMVFCARSQRLKAMGKAALLPSILNINEPVVYGAPIVLNPLLMVPFWLTTVISAAIAWLACVVGFIPVPAAVYQIWYTPQPLMAWFAGGRSVNSLILVAVIFVICLVIYYPFLKAYDTKQINEENQEE